MTPRVRADARALVVVGNGMAAARLVEELGRAGARTVTSPCSATSRTPPYNRILLSAVLEGTHTPERLTGCATRRVVRRPRRRPAPRRRVLEVDRERRERDAGRRRGASATTGSCSPPAASRRCRRSAGWSGWTAGCTRGARVPHAWTTAGASSRRRCRGAPQRAWWSAAACSASRWPGRWPCAASPPRSSRAPSTCSPARSDAAAGAVLARDLAGSAPRSTPAPARSGLDRAGARLANGNTLDDRPGRAHRRRPAVDRAGPPARA